MESLINFDTNLFLFINKDLSNFVTDFAMPIITNKKYWLIVYIIGFIYLLYKLRLKGLLIIITLIVGVGIADQISAGLIKDWVGRLRPCQSMDDINLLINCGSGKSFPSAHATNNLFAAFTLSYFFPRQWTIFYTLAFLVAISRVFVGVHYPLDVLAGGILGIMIGFLMTRIAGLLSILKK